MVFTKNQKKYYAVPHRKIKTDENNNGMRISSLQMNFPATSLLYITINNVKKCPLLNPGLGFTHLYEYV